MMPKKLKKYLLAWYDAEEEETLEAWVTAYDEDDAKHHCSDPHAIACEL